ncbi:type II toxin-antitoxin system VapC family toxin [Rhodoflexus sp.]
MRKVFVDTHVLLFATQSDSPLFQTAQNRLREAAETSELYTSGQVMRAYAHTFVREAVQNGYPMPDAVHAVLKNVNTFRSHIRLLPDDETALNTWEYLLPSLASTSEVLDAARVATMKAAGINYLLTYKAEAYNRFDNLITVWSLV